MAKGRAALYRSMRFGREPRLSSEAERQAACMGPSVVNGGKRRKWARVVRSRRACGRHGRRDFADRASHAGYRLPGYLEDRPEPGEESDSEPEPEAENETESETGTESGADSDGE